MSDSFEDIEAANKRLRGTLAYILAQATSGYPTVLSVIKANAAAALDDKWQNMVEAAQAALRKEHVGNAKEFDIAIGSDTIRAFHKLVGSLSADEMMGRGLTGVEVQLVKAVTHLAGPRP